MSPREPSEPGPDGQTYRQNLERGQRVLDLLEDPQDPENLKELKGMMGNRSWDDFLSVLKDIHLAHQDKEEQEQQLRDDHQALKIKYRDLKEHLKDQLRERATAPADDGDDEVTPTLRRATSTEEPKSKKGKKPKLPLPPIFLNDGKPTWEDWYVEMTVKLRNIRHWDEEDRIGFVLGRTGGDPRQLIQTSYLEDEYSTAEEMLQTLANTYNDSNKKAKARTMYRNLKMGENERFDTFISRFTACAAKAGITDNTMKREDLFDKVTKPLRDVMRPCLSLYPTFTDFREQLSLLYWELEAEKRRSPRATTEKPTSSTRKPASNSRKGTTTSATTTNTGEEKQRPKYDDKRRAELSLKGACFICEEVGHMAAACPKKGSIKALEANEEESSSESENDSP
jgi:Zinc knuckle